MHPAFALPVLMLPAPAPGPAAPPVLPPRPQEVYLSNQCREGALSLQLEDAAEPAPLTQGLDVTLLDPAVPARRAATFRLRRNQDIQELGAGQTAVLTLQLTGRSDWTRCRILRLHQREAGLTAFVRYCLHPEGNLPRGALEAHEAAGHNAEVELLGPNHAVFWGAPLDPPELEPPPPAGPAQVPGASAEPPGPGRQ